MNNFIGKWFIDKSVCDGLINYFETEANVGPGTVEHGKVIKEVKDCSETHIKCYDPILNDYHVELQKVCEKYKKEYSFSSLTDKWSIIDDVKIQRYYPGEAFYKWHSERITGYGLPATRHLTFMTYLNDVTDGGETEFYHQGVRVIPQKGLTLIWPADWTFTHRGIPSPSQEKYIITGWLHYYA